MASLIYKESTSIYVLDDVWMLGSLVFWLYRVFANPLGIFLVSLVANSIPFIAIPYLLVVLTYSMIFQNMVDKLVVAVASALGASIGKLVIYFLGSTFRLKLSSESIKNLELFNKIASKGLFIAIFLFASLPLPDDVLYIPLGISKYNLIKYFIAVFLGKLVMTSSIVIYGHSINILISESGLLMPVYILLTIIFTYIIIKVNWTAVMDALNDGGLNDAIMEFIRQVSKAFKINKLTSRIRNYV